MTLLASSRGHARHLRLRAQLRTHNADHAKPLLVHLYVLTDRIGRSKQIEPGGNAQYADRSALFFILAIEELTP